MRVAGGEGEQAKALREAKNGGWEQLQLRVALPASELVSPVQVTAQDGQGTLSNDVRVRVEVFALRVQADFRAGW